MSNIDIRKTWKEFMESKGHHEIENVSLVPQNDPSLLFVNSGMFPLVPYLTGQVEPPAKRLYNIQRCVRFDDIEEVGDDRHTSFFHMIGNWSMGDYFKETQIPMMGEFLFEKLGIDPKRLFITVFAGNDIAPRDDESISLWKEVFKKYGIEAEVSEVKLDEKTAEPLLPDGKSEWLNESKWEIGKFPTERIFAYPMKKNWWQRGNAVGELGGPDSEMFYDTQREHDPKFGEYCHLNCDCGRFIEIGNNVFMQYQLDENMKWIPLQQKNVDHGSGFERIAMAVMHESDIFKTSEFYPIIEELEKLSGKNYAENKKNFQIIADHMRAATFIISDGILPSNKDQGYIVRRLIRRSVRAAQNLNVEGTFAKGMVVRIIEMFKEYYPHLEEKKDFIIDEVVKEEKKFLNTLQKGLKELEKITSNNIANKNNDIIITPEEVFNLYQSYGFPIELTVEEVKLISKDLKLDFDEKNTLEEVRAFIKKHQEASRAGSEQKFKGGLADTSEKTTALHTTAHLFLEAARRVLGDHVHQRGSNITTERIRFDFSHPQKLTDDEIKKIENIVNEQISLELDRELKEYDTDKAFEIGAEGEFREKYGDKVNVYKFYKKSEDAKNALEKLPVELQNSATLQQYSLGITKAIEKNSNVKDNFKDEYVFSFEICGGPHVQNTKEIQKYGKFKITKEESSSSGVRRIKAELI